MNKKGQELVQMEVIEYIILIVLAIVLLMTTRTLISVEKYNGLMVDDLALTINSVFIPENNVAIDHDMGLRREIIFEDGIVKMHIENIERQQGSWILVDRNYIFEFEDKETNSLEIFKENERVIVR